MIPEISALVFEFNFDPLPFPRTYLTFCLAIRVARLNSLNVITKLSCDLSKQKDDSTFIYGLVPKTSKVDWITIGRAVFHFCMFGFIFDR